MRSFVGCARAHQPESCIVLSAEAKATFVDWFNDQHQLMVAANGIEQGTLAKLPAQAARLALVLHCLRDPDGSNDQLDRQTLEDALELAEYFLGHARRVIPAFTSPPASSLSTRVRNQMEQTNGWTSRTDLYGALGGHVRAAELDAALEELRQSGLLEERTTKTGGRPARSWRLTGRGMDPVLDNAGSPIRGRAE